MATKISSVVMIMNRTKFEGWNFVKSIITWIGVVTTIVVLGQFGILDILRVLISLQNRWNAFGIQRTDRFAQIAIDALVLQIQCGALIVLQEGKRNKK